MSEWISVKDREPEFSDVYMVTGLDIELEIVSFCEDFGWVDDYEITHWMPLPSPPEEL